MKKGSFMSKLYANIGYKVKCLAFVSCIVETIGAVIGGIALLIDWQWWGIFVIFAGPIIAWVTTWMLYAFGELVDKACDIDQSIKAGNVALQNSDSNPTGHGDAKEIQQAAHRAQQQAEREAEKQRRREAKLQQAAIYEQQRAERKAEKQRVPSKVKTVSTIVAIAMAIVSLSALALACCLIASNLFYAIALGLVWLALTVMIIPVYKLVYNKCMEKYDANDGPEGE